MPDDTDLAPNSIQDRFSAAVNVIRTLPANGSFQPSREMLLRFYALYKQATEGPCETPRPAFYDVTNRAKWDAYKGMEDMPREEAMEEYVCELKKIVEMMSLTPEVSQFLDKLGSFYELVNEDGTSDYSKLKAILPASPKPAFHPVANGTSRTTSVPSTHAKQSLPIALEAVTKLLLSTPDVPSDDESDLEMDAFQDAIPPAAHSDFAKERRNSVDSFKSQPESFDGSAQVVQPKDSSVFQALFPELERLRNRTDNLERRVMQHDQRIITAEAKIDKLVRQQNAASCNGIGQGPQLSDGRTTSQNRVVDLFFRYWRSLEHRLQRHPVLVLLFALAWPVLLQIAVLLYRRARSRRR